MKSLIRTLLLTTLVVLPLLAPPTANAARKMEVAVQDDGVFIFDDPFITMDRDSALRFSRFLGVTHIRMNILWWQAVPMSQRNQTTVPSNIVYDFRVWDDAVARAAAYGLKSQITLAGDPPAWACGNKKVPYECDGYKPNVKLWKGFVKAAVAHFKGRVKRYSLWNEPSWYTWLSPHKKSPLLYRKLAMTGYKAAHRADDNAEVVIGELTPQLRKGLSIPPLRFIREMVCVNKRLERTRRANRKCGRRPLKFDAFAHHPYDFEHKPTYEQENRDEVTMANIDDLRKLLDKLRKKGLIKPKKKKFPIYLTEYGYMVADNPQVLKSRRIKERKRKKWIVQGWRMAQEAKRVKQQMHYNLISPQPGSPSGYFDLGLIDANGTPRPSYTALRNYLVAAAADGKVAKPRPCAGGTSC
ncbi:MAG TPA: hypothetical protein VF111_08045 [Thermoanaerobaculia bacterium]